MMRTDEMAAVFQSQTTRQKHFNEQLTNDFEKS